MCKQPLAFNLATGKLLFIDCFQHLATTPDGWFGVRLALSQLKQYFRFLKFLLVFLERFIYVFAIFRIYYQHFLIPPQVVF